MATCKFDYILSILYFSATHFLANFFLKVNRTYSLLWLKVEAAILS